MICQKLESLPRSGTFAKWPNFQITLKHLNWPFELIEMDYITVVLSIILKYTYYSIPQLI